MKKVRQIILNKNSPIAKNATMYNERQKTIEDSLLQNIDTKGSRSPKPTKKPSLSKYSNSQIDQLLLNYALLLKRVSQYAEIAKLEIKNQIQKHDVYYNEIIQAIRNQQYQTYLYMVEKLKSIDQTFNLKIAALKMKISQLTSTNIPLNLQKQMAQLQVQKIVKIELIKIQTLNVKSMSQQISKLCFQMGKSFSHYPQINNNISQLSCDQEIAWGKQKKHKHQYSAPQIISESPQLNEDSIFSIE